MSTQNLIEGCYSETPQTFVEDEATASKLSSFRASKHFLSTLITAIGNFSVQYNFQAVSIALIVMSSSQCTLTQDECNEGNQAVWVHSTATATVFAGAIAGQLSMGYAGDVLGRTKAMALTLSIAAVSAFCSAVVPTGSPEIVYSMIILFRFFLGIGLGGVYPISATKAAEDGGDSHGHVDSKSASIAFFWQSPGAMAPWLLAYCMTGSSIAVDMQWRLLLGLGCIPAAVVVVLSVLEAQASPEHLAEEVAYEETRALSISDLPDPQHLLGLEQDTAHFAHMTVYELLQQREIWMKLLATGGGWFFYDICYYGVNLFGGEILAMMDKESDDNVSSTESIRELTGKQLIANGMAIPACLLTILLLNKYGTKRLQVAGFLFIVLSFVIMASLFFPLKNSQPDLLFFFYCMLLFSLSWGPNVTTFILPAEVYPKRVRSTFNGISAALGKLGAVVGAYMFGSIAEVTSYPVVMIMCAVFAFIGAVVSYYVIPTAPALGPLCRKKASDNDNDNVYCADDVKPNWTA